MNKIDDKAILSEVTERIFQFIEAEGLSNADFAAAIDIGPAVVSHLKNGRNKVSLNVYAQILESFPQLNPDWLLFGEGGMYRNKATQIREEPNLFNIINEENTPQLTTTESEVIKPSQAVARKITKIVVFYDDN
ncbi:MAG: hypothetical protein CSA15_04895, partial [Candidatus Delongbacteria bacterium]